MSWERVVLCFEWKQEPLSLLLEICHKGNSGTTQIGNPCFIVSLRSTIFQLRKSISRQRNKGISTDILSFLIKIWTADLQDHRPTCYHLATLTPYYLFFLVLFCFHFQIKKNIFLYENQNKIHFKHNKFTQKPDLPIFKFNKSLHWANQACSFTSTMLVKQVSN
jgi:hypothetical protein